MFHQRYQRAIEALQKHHIDAWVIFGRETKILGEPALLYLVPIEVLGRTILLITKEGERIAIANPIETEEMQDSGLFTQVVASSMPVEALTELIRVRLPMRRIALDISPDDPSADGLSHSDYLALKQCFDHAGFTGDIVSAICVMKQVRGRKSDDEVAKIARAVSEAMSIFEEARPLMRLGMSGRDVQRMFQDIIAGKGHDFSWDKQANPFVSVGARSSYNCRKPPDDVFIEPGDLVNVDLGIRVDGFASDNQRSFYALCSGETVPPFEVVHAWETVQRMNREICLAMCTGTDSNTLTEIGNRIMLEAGYEQGWKSSYGHEIGLFAHIGGMAAGRSARNRMDAILEENMTFTLEPAILTSHGRLCQEEVIRVTKNGGQMLSTPQEKIWLIAH
jgi:Xaa-Pro aminopeptidase